MVLPLWKEIAVACCELSVFTDNIQANVKILGEKIETAIKEEENVMISNF